jgi:hypothetical protein
MLTPTPPNPLPPDRNVAPILLGVTIPLDVIAVTLTALRLWVRYAGNILGWDDYTIAISVTLANIRMAMQILQQENGNGRHRWYITPEAYKQNNKWGWYAQMFLFSGICVCKISICLLILRIKNEKTLRRILICVMTGLVILNFGYIIILVAECSPVQTYWRVTGGKCWTPKIRIYSIYVSVGKITL